MDDPATPAPTSPPGPPSRRGGSQKRLRNRSIRVACTDDEFTAIHEAAQRAGLSAAAFLRCQGIGTSGPRAVRRPPVERAELVRLLGAVGKLGSNVNQIARVLNADGLIDPPLFAEASADVAVMRAAIMQALGRAPGDVPHADPAPGSSSDLIRGPGQAPARPRP